MKNCPSCARWNPMERARCEDCGAPLEGVRDVDRSALDQEIRELLRQERAIEAIKLCRERTGLGLKEAKDLVDAVAAGRDVAPPPAGSPDAELIALLKEGRKIDAIKRHRERTGLGLKEAKDAVEALAARERILTPARGCLALLGLFLFR